MMSHACRNPSVPLNRVLETGYYPLLPLLYHHLLLNTDGLQGPGLGGD